MPESKGPETRHDPSGNTEAFQAFARSAAPQVPVAKRNSMAIAVSVAAAVIIVVVVVVLLATN